MINEFAVLKCDCGGDFFTPVLRLKYKTEGGTIQEPAGHKCAACGTIVDNAYMIRLIDIQRKRADAKRLLDEATAAEMVKKPKTEAAPAVRV